MRKLLSVPILILLALGAYGPVSGLFISPELTEQALVTRVIDGDTLVLVNGERVRLLGLDTPERGEFLYQEAKDWLKDKSENRTVTLEPGDEDRDKYGRLLRYVWSEGKLLNLELVKLGLAPVFMMEPDEKYYQDFLDAESSAREAGLGLWNS